MGRRVKATDDERRALATFVKLSRAAEAVAARVNAHLADWDLTVSQFGTLDALYHLGPLHQKEIGAKVLKSSGNMTAVIDNLERRGLVERRRDTDDRRWITVHLTKAGKDLVEEIFPSHAAGVAREMAILDAEEQSTLGELCRTVGRQERPVGLRR